MDGLNGSYLDGGPYKTEEKYKGNIYLYNSNSIMLGLNRSFLGGGPYQTDSKY